MFSHLSFRVAHAISTQCSANTCIMFDRVVDVSDRNDGREAVKQKLILMAVVLALLVGIPAVIAINYGEPDGNGHPHVGIMVAKDANNNPLWRCSGTLLSSTVFLTAGHCTEAPAVTAEIWFEPEVFRGDPAFGYPFEGPTSVTGTTYTHPSYNPGHFSCTTWALWCWIPL